MMYYISMNIEIPVLQFILQSNLLTVIISIFLLTFLFSSKTVNSRTATYFVNLIMLTLILVVADSIDFYIEKSPNFHPIRYWSSAIGYSMRPGIAYFVCLVVHTKIDKNRIYWSIPAFINVAVSFISIPTHIMFWFSPDNQFHRGPLGLLPFAVSGFYVILLSYWTIKELTKSVRAAIVLYPTVPSIILAVYLESVCHLKFVLPEVIVTLVMFYYLSYNVELYKRDALTGLLNRRCFYLALNDLKNDNFILVSMDLNNLKQINDTEGHSAGDRAIITVTEIMTFCFGKKNPVYRTGGDEFTAICPYCKDENAEAIVEKMEYLIGQTPYSIAYGYERYNVGDNMDEIIKKADMRMYEKKLAMKKRQQLEREKYQREMAARKE